MSDKSYSWLALMCVLLFGCGSHITPDMIETAKRVCEDRQGYESVYAYWDNTELNVICKDDFYVTIDGYATYRRGKSGACK